jgi:hypothetical protein
MRIFLSFASEQRELAEPILLALRDRGHTVFFSHDDLPAGGSFDMRIQRAVQESDLMIFLVSPEAVTKGRYTLTELTFARDRWPNPNGRILPVMIAETALTSLPNYLKAVTLLQPEGNVAAETSAAVDKMVRGSNRRTILIFALCGILTGVLSYLSIRYGPETLRFSLFHPDRTARAPIIPGVCFGALVAYCCYRFGSRERFSVVLAFLFTVGAWLLAHDSAVSTFTYLDRFAVEGGSPMPDVTGDVDPLNQTLKRRERLPIAKVLTYAVGGFVGGLGTILAVAIANPRFRRLDPWLLTLFVAVLVAILAEIYGDTAGAFAWLVLFTTWQAAVIASIGYGLARDAPE